MRAREVELERVAPLLLARDGQLLPVPQLRVVARAGHDRRDEHAIGKRRFDPAETRHPPVERLVGDELPVPRGVQRRAGPLLHREPRRIGVRAQELRLRADDVDDRVQTDCLRHDAAPARLERAQDVRLRFGRRRRRQQKRVREANAGERRREVGRHGCLQGAGRPESRPPTIA